MNQSVWLEAAINGVAGRGLQPRIPITPTEIIEDALAAADSGAAIIHIHVYDGAGAPVEDTDLYARVIEGVRARSEAIVYPTLALNGDRETRLAPIRELAARGLMEVGVVDPGSVNITHRMQALAGADGIHYSNPDDHIRALLALAAADGWRPAYAIYEPGFARLGAALAAAQRAKGGLALRSPVYRVMFSDNLLFGMTPSRRGLDFYAAHLDETAPGAPRMLSGLDADIDSLIEPALAHGFHIRVGLEDAPFGTDLSNAEIIAAAARRIIHAGYRLAAPAEIRAAP